MDALDIDVQLMGSLHDGNLLNYRSILILLTYLTTATLIVTYLVAGLFQRPQDPEHTEWKVEWGKAAFFFVLAIVSLGFTWYYMFSFFAYSYHDWACKSNFDGALSLDSLELWLRDTKLFKEAWGSVVETPQRYWWSGQIFFWTTAWSLFIGVMGRRYQIPNTWAYMLLGQIVAISFAQQLFYIAILFSRPYFDRQAAAAIPSRVVEILPLLISLVSSVVVPYVFDTKYFYAVLLIPHILLFVPACFDFSKPGNNSKNHAATTKRYTRVFSWILGISFAFQVGTLYLALQDTSPLLETRSRDSCALQPAQDPTQNPWQRLSGTMFEHPAVSSVSWDVVFCTVGMLSWAAMHEFQPEKMLGDVDNPVRVKEE